MRIPIPNTGFYIVLLFRLPLSYSTVSEDAGIEPRTVATSVLAVISASHSVSFHPQNSIARLIWRLSSASLGRRKFKAILSWILPKNTKHKCSKKDTEISIARAIRAKFVILDLTSSQIKRKCRYSRSKVRKTKTFIILQGSIFWSKTDIYSPPPLGNLYFFPKKTA
jgi:hypothetical protein